MSAIASTKPRDLAVSIQEPGGGRFLDEADLDDAVFDREAIQYVEMNLGAMLAQREESGAAAPAMSAEDLGVLLLLTESIRRDAECRREWADSIQKNALDLFKGGDDAR